MQREVFEEVLSVTLSQLRLSGWFNFNTTKLVLALTIAANHQDLAADFVRFVLLLSHLYIAQTINAISLGVFHL